MCADSRQQEGVHHTIRTVVVDGVVGLLFAVPSTHDDGLVLCTLSG